MKNWLIFKLNGFPSLNFPGSCIWVIFRSISWTVDYVIVMSKMSFSSALSITDVLVYQRIQNLGIEYIDRTTTLICRRQYRIKKSARYSQYCRVSWDIISITISWRRWLVEVLRDIFRSRNFIFEIKTSLTPDVFQYVNCRVYAVIFNLFSYYRYGVQFHAEIVCSFRLETERSFEILRVDLFKDLHMRGSFSSDTILRPPGCKRARKGIARRI